MTNILKITLIAVISLLIIALVFLLVFNLVFNNQKENKENKGVYVYEQNIYKERICGLC